MSETQWHRTLGVNLDSVFGLVQAAVGQMERQNREEKKDGGHIVLISSTAGQRGEANHADYAVTKGALISLTKSLSSELAPKGIRVNCVAPGWVTTDMSAASLEDGVLGPRIAARFRSAAQEARLKLRGRFCFYARLWRDSCRVRF